LLCFSLFWLKSEYKRDCEEEIYIRRRKEKGKRKKEGSFDGNIRIEID